MYSYQRQFSELLLYFQGPSCLMWVRPLSLSLSLSLRVLLFVYHSPWSGGLSVCGQQREREKGRQRLCTRTASLASMYSDTWSLLIADKMNAVVLFVVLGFFSRLYFPAGVKLIWTNSNIKLLKFIKYRCLWLLKEQFCSLLLDVWLICVHYLHWNLLSL